MLKISVVVPIYNVEPYLKRCIDSILAQTYKNIEVILIDDGSKDNSGKICDKYAQKDNRIVVIHKNNEGVSKARNLGIEVACGDYITFIDSDDWIDEDYFIKVIKSLENNSPVLLKNSYVINQKNKTIDMDILKKTVNMTNKDYLNYIIKLNRWEPVAAFYKADICKQCFFQQDIRFGEDLLFNYSFSKKAMGLYLYQPLSKYHYFRRIDSATMSYHVYKMVDDLKVLESIMSKESKMLREMIFSLRYMPRLINYTLEGLSSNDNRDSVVAQQCRTKIKTNICTKFFLHLPLYRQIQSLCCLLPSSIAVQIFRLYKLMR